MNENLLTLRGNLTAPPLTGKTRTGELWARLRVASTVRRFDRATGSWLDVDTTYLTATCWRKLAHNAATSLGKGDPVVVVGRLRQRSWDDRDGQRRWSTEVDAELVAPDLTRCSAKVTRASRSLASDAPPDAPTPAAEPGRDPWGEVRDPVSGDHPAPGPDDLAADDPLHGDPVEPAVETGGEAGGETDGVAHGVTSAGMDAHAAADPVDPEPEKADPTAA